LRTKSAACLAVRSVIVCTSISRFMPSSSMTRTGQSRSIRLRTEAKVTAASMQKPAEPSPVRLRSSLLS
jgi:hypothetical protein